MAPESVAVTPLAGTAVQDSDGNWNADGLCRIAYGEGVTVTLAADTTVIPIQEQRLALRAGRIFVDVEPGRKGFEVVVGEGRITTLGTSFLVEADRFGGRVAVEKGRILDGLTCGVVASVGKGEVAVYRRPRVAVMDTLCRRRV